MEPDLEALDPDTGSPLPPGVVDGGRVQRAHPRRSVHLAWAAVGLALFSLGFAASALYNWRAITSLRGIERQWRTFEALDESRGLADEMLTRESITGNEDFANRVTGQVAAQEARSLSPVSDAFAKVKVSDRRLRGLRTLLANKVASTVRQLASRDIHAGQRPGGANLLAGDLELRGALRHWHLAPKQLAHRPSLSRLNSLRTELTFFSPKPTGVRLAGLTAGGFVTIDIDRNEVQSRALTTTEHAVMIGRQSYVAVLDAGVLTAYAPTGDALWSLPADSAAMGDTTDNLWVERTGDVSMVSGDGTAGPTVRLPVGSHLGGVVARNVLALKDAAGAAYLWSVGEKATPLAGEFVAAGGRLVLTRQHRGSAATPFSDVLGLSAIWGGYDESTFLGRVLAGAVADNGSAVAAGAVTADGVASVVVFEPATVYTGATGGAGMSLKANEHFVSRQSESLALGTAPSFSTGGRWLFWLAESANGKDPWIIERSAADGEVARLRVDVPGLRAIAPIG